MNPGGSLIAALMAAMPFLLCGCVADPLQPTGGVLTVATVRDLVLIGTSTTLGDTGSFELQSVYGPALHCAGRFRYQPFPAGIAFFDCSDGQSGRIRIRAEGYLTGEGSGDSDMGSVHVVYGYSVEEMNELLDLPPGTRLVQDDRGVGLVNEDSEN